MFPSGDFNFVVAGIATFAATIGYACSRRLNTSQTLSDTLEEATREPASSSKSQEHVPSQVMPSSSGNSLLQTLMNAAPAAYTLTRRGSMKRKAPHDGFDEDVQRKLEYPHNLSNIYPNKRSRTPSTESDYSEVAPLNVAPDVASDSIMSHSVDHDMDTPMNDDEPQAATETPATEPPETPSPLVLFPPTPRPPSPAPVSQPTEREESPELQYPPSPAPQPKPEREESPELIQYPSSPQPLPAVGVVAEVTPPVVETTPTAPTAPATPEPETVKVPSAEEVVEEEEEPKEEQGFVLSPAKFVFSQPAFAPAPFFNAEKQENKIAFPARQLGFFTLPQTPKAASPAFSAFSTPNKGFAAFAGSGSPFLASPFTSTTNATKVHETPTTKSIWTVDVGLASQQNETDSSAVDPFITSFDASESALSGTKPSTPSLLPATYKHVTGEEDESVDAELKGVKLFVKRGNKGFSEGVAGHVKILTSYETSGQRVLFRRDPLMKISMNVRIGATVRCTYTPEDNVVKLVLKEAVEGQTKQELVIYVIKPGRHCSKDDFAVFAQKLYETVQGKSF